MYKYLLLIIVLVGCRPVDGTIRRECVKQVISGTYYIFVNKVLTPYHVHSCVKYACIEYGKPDKIVSDNLCKRGE